MQMKPSLLAFAGCLALVTFGARGDSDDRPTNGLGINAYYLGDAVPDVGFVDVTDQVPQLGGTLLAGNPRIRIRFDAPPDGVTAHGVFEQDGKGTFRIVFPFNEHIQVIRGRLRLTDMNGVVIELGPGDSYFIAQGTVIIWETLTPFFQKSFFDYTSP
jgi:uncharacterized cupin superfamily protein